jgi:hypothetical protein
MYWTSAEVARVLEPAAARPSLPADLAIEGASKADDAHFRLRIVGEALIVNESCVARHVDDPAGTAVALLRLY